MSKTKINLVTAISIIAANMIGVGVFTSLGFQVLGITSVLPLLLLWVVGGIVALSGALSYGELAAVFPRSGGEYNFLSRVYHPAVGFMSGWVSATIGFAAPIAMIAMAFGSYFSNIWDIPQPVLATLLLCAVTVVNMLGIRVGSAFQVFFTITNLTLIIGIIVCGVLLSDSSHYAFSTGSEDWGQVFTKSFAVSLVYVSFAYSGWNSATYIADDIKDSAINLPKALFIGTSIVMLLYILLNFVFLYSTPIELLAGKVQVGYVAAESIFGPMGAKIIAGIISVGLIASINSMMFIGPRVTEVIGQDYKAFRFLSNKSENGSPMTAIIVQFVVAMILIHTSSFDQILTCLVFTLSVFTTLTVLGVFVNRWKNGKKSNVYSTFLYPVTPVIFIAIELWMMYYILNDEQHQIPSLIGLANVALGALVYWVVNGYSFKNKAVLTEKEEAIL